MDERNQPTEYNNGQEYNNVGWCNFKSLTYLNLKKCNSIGVCRIWVDRAKICFYYFWQSAYTLSVESRDLFRGYGLQGHAPPENFEKMLHFKVYFNQISK